MSLAEFQRAFADLIASPERCLEVRADATTILRAYSLSEREVHRLQVMVADEGMSINCTLYRVNRLIPLHGVLPLTCGWMGDRLLPELEAFWESSRDATLQFRREAWRFGHWLQQRIADGVLSGGPIEDALRFELASFDLRCAGPAAEDPELYPHPRKRLLRFTYDPQEVINPEAPRGPALEALPQGEWVLLDATGPELAVSRLVPELGRQLAKLGGHRFE